jgi:hypothetical protein
MRRKNHYSETQAQQRRGLSWGGYIICNPEAFCIAGLKNYVERLEEFDIW